MTGWNLPPGVSESDIPGNRPIDEVIDRLCSECDLEDSSSPSPYVSSSSPLDNVVYEPILYIPYAYFHYWQLE